MWLSLGIKVDTFKFSKYRIEGLYLKLDKKLILKADKVVIPKYKAEPSTKNIEKTFENVKYLLTFFQSIDIQKIYFNNNRLGIYYLDNILQISTDDYLIRGKIHRIGHLLYAEIPMLYLKKQDIIMRGNLTYDLYRNTLKTEGKFSFKNISGYCKVMKEKKALRFTLHTDTFTDIYPLVGLLHLSHQLKLWSIEKIRAKEYTVHQLSGKGIITSKGFIWDEQSLIAHASLKDVKIYFKKGLPPVHAKKMMIDYTKSRGLSFHFVKPLYEGHTLSKSYVHMKYLDTNHSTLTIHLHLHTALDKTIKHLLKNYHITIPVIQKKGNIDGDVLITIGLHQNNIKITSKLTLHNSHLLLGEVPLYITKGTIKYLKDKIILQNIILDNKHYKGLLQGEINLKQKQAHLTFNAKKMEIFSKNRMLFYAKNTLFPFLIDYQNNLHIQVPKLSLDIDRKKDITYFTLHDLKDILPYVEENSLFQNGGNVKFETKDFQRFQFHGILKPASCFIYENNSSCQNMIPFQGYTSEKDFQFNAFNQRFKYSHMASKLTIHNINIDIKQLMKNTLDTNSRNKKNILIIGSNSHFRYGKYTLPLDSYNIKLTTKGYIEAMGSALGDIVKFNKKHHYISIQAFRIKDKVLDEIIHFKGLQKGRYTIKMEGNPQKIMKGEILIEGGMMKNFSTYKKTADLVNTIPELSSLHKQHYAQKGFKIEEGMINYKVMNQNHIYFDSIYVKGEIATLVGKGSIDLLTKVIDIHLEIHLARNMGQVLGNIPLLGYILMGKDKSITVGLHISGTLDKPIVHTSAVTDILSSPFGIIKRTLESPNHIINQ